MLKPILRPYDTLVSTRDVDFDTTKPTYPTRPDKSHVSHVVTDSGWEGYVAAALEERDRDPDRVRVAAEARVGLVREHVLGEDADDSILRLLAGVAARAEKNLSSVFRGISDKKGDENGAL